MYAFLERRTPRRGDLIANQHQATFPAIKLASALASSWASVCGFHPMPNPGPS